MKAIRLPVNFASPSAINSAVKVLPDPGGPYMPILSAACSARARRNGIAINFLPPSFIVDDVIKISVSDIIFFT